MRIRLELVPHKSKALGEICQGIWRVPYILLEKEEEFLCVKENEESFETFGRYVLKLPLYHGSRSTIR
jgi:hypothetical protein